MAAPTDEAICQGEISGKRVVIKLITPPRISDEECYAKAFSFDKLVCAMLDLGTIEDTVRAVKEAMRDNPQVNRIVNSAPEATPPRSPRRSLTGSVSRTRRDCSDFTLSLNL